MTVDLVLDALDNAVADQKPSPGLIFHTDLGSQYTSEDFEYCGAFEPAVRNFIPPSADV